MGVLHTKLSRTTKALRKWFKTLAPLGKLAMAVCIESINQLKRAQESRQLSTGEQSLIKHLKTRFLMLVVIQKAGQNRDPD
jgi:hypothetical protein